MVKKYLISFYGDSDTNSDVSVAIRTRIEQLSPHTWIQIFPNLLALQSDCSLEDIYSEIEAVSSTKRFVVAEISNVKTNETRSNNLLGQFDY